MRWLGAIVLSALVVVGLLTLLGQGPSVPGLGLGLNATSASDEPAAGYSATHARLVQTDAAGAPQYVLVAQDLSQDSNSEDIAARDLKLDYVPSAAPAATQPWVLTARQGRLPGGSLQITLSGNVRIVGRPAGASELMRLETSALDFDMDKQIARTALPVSLYWGSRRLTTRGLNADLKQGTLSLESSVHGRFPP